MRTHIKSYADMYTVACAHIVVREKWRQGLGFFFFRFTPTGARVYIIYRRNEVRSGGGEEEGREKSSREGKGEEVRVRGRGRGRESRESEMRDIGRSERDERERRERRE
jgi:hypothetical protein